MTYVVSWNYPLTNKVAVKTISAKCVCKNTQEEKGFSSCSIKTHQNV